MDLHTTTTEAAAASLLAATHQPGRFVGDVPVLVMPQGFNVASLETHLPAPVRKRGTATLNDAESFISLVKDQTSDSTRIFSTTNPPTFTAVFNHTAGQAGWGDHRAAYNAPLSVEWKIWTAADKEKMNQADIALFLEANLLDVCPLEPTPAQDGKPAHPGSPDGSSLLEICRTLEATKKVDFKSSIRLGDGSTQFTYNEEVSGIAKQGQILIPEQFSIGIPVFENGVFYQVDVRLRYRIDSGRLVFWMELVRAHKIMEDAVTELRKTIADGTGLPILNGSPNK